MGWLDSNPVEAKDCGVCGGTGSVNGGLGNQVTCSGCQGTGKK